MIYVLAMTLQPLPRDRLVFLFWPDKPEVTARRNLSRVASYIRNELPHPELLRINQESIGLNPELVWSDAARFMELAEQRSRAKREEMVALYTGSFLSGFSLPSNSEFDFWLTSQQQQYEGRYLNALKDLIQIKFAAQDLSKAIHYAQRYLAIDELAEDVHQQLIRLYAASGDRSAALRQFEACALILERELGVEPLPETWAASEAARSPGGKPRPQIKTQPTWTVLPSLDLPLIGRQEAWEALVEAYHQFQRGGVIIIGGEPGIGKSRLLQEFATSQDRVVLSGNCHASTQRLPYQPLTQALRQALSQLQLWAEIRPIWLSEASRILPELGEHFPDLPQAIAVEPEQAQARLYEALGQCLLGIAANAPILLCLDDLQWADEATLGWLSHLSGRLAGSGVCILAAYRTAGASAIAGLRESFVRMDLMAEVALSGLSLEAIMSILERLPTPAPQPRNLAARIKDATGGNPFFVLETIRAMLESGQLASPPETLPLAESVQEAILGRLEKLSPVARQVLEAAAVLAPDLDQPLLQETAGRADFEVADGLDELVRRQLLQVGEEGLAFRHDLLRTAVYEALTPWRQRLLHRRAAEGLEQHYQAELASSYDTISGQIAAHYERSGFPDKAIPHYLQAAAAAQRVYALAEAYAYTVKGLAQLEKVVNRSEHASHELDLQLLLGAILLDTERLFDPQIEAVFGRAVELSEQLQEPLKQARALLGLSYFNVNRTMLDLGQTQSEQLLTLAEALDSNELLVQAHWNLGAISLFRGQFIKSQIHLEQAKAYYRREESAPTMVFWQPADMACQGYLAQVLQYLGYSDQALEQIHSAMTLAKNAEHPVYLLSVLTLATQLHQQREDAASTITVARELLALSDQHQGPIFLLIGSLYMGWALFTQGQREQGLDHLKQALLMLRKIPTIPGTPLCLSVLAEVYTRAGQLEKAAALLDQAWAVMEKTGLFVSETDLYRLRGELLWQQGESADTIEANFLRAVQVARHQQAKWLELRAMMSLARWWQSQDRNEEARHQLAEIFGWFTEGLDTVYLKEAKALLEELS